VAPMTVATLRDQTGSYHAGFAVLMTLAAIGALAVLALPGTRLAAAQPAGQAGGS
jgi:MFS-type transporter involved in bile tolerance (Atg22 family)